MKGAENLLLRGIWLALLALGVAVFAAGVMLPVMTVKKMVLVKNTFTVLAAIGELLADKTFALGLLLLMFSVVLPLVKFALMAAYWWFYPQQRHFLALWHRCLGKVAKFSMLDVFVLGQMLMILKLGWLVEVEIHGGIYWLTAAVLLSLLAGMAVDRDMERRYARLD